MPTTEELARAFLHRSFRPTAGPAAARLVYSEDPGAVARGPLIAAPLQDTPFAVAAVERLEDLPTDRLAAADGEIFPAARLDSESDDVELYLRRITSAPAPAVGRFEPDLFAARGPARIAIAHPWTLAAPRSGSVTAERCGGRRSRPAPTRAASAAPTGR